MKRIVLAILLFSVVGCSKDSTKLIVGTWALVDYTAINVRTGEKMSGSTDVKIWTFYESGTAYINNSTPLTYTIKDKDLTLVFVNSGRKILYKIVELSDSTLKVYWYFVPGQYQDGMDQWYTFNRVRE